jgi:hypothetical protein
VNDSSPGLPEMVADRHILDAARPRIMVQDAASPAALITPTPFSPPLPGGFKIYLLNLAGRLVD